MWSFKAIVFLIIVAVLILCAAQKGPTNHDVVSR